MPTSNPSRKGLKILCLFSNRNYSILYFLIKFRTPVAEVVFFIAEIKKVVIL